MSSPTAESSHAMTPTRRFRLFMSGAGRDLLLSERGDRETRLEPIELFFDLVYVLAVTQLTHFLLDHLSPRGAAEVAILLLAVWLSWTFTTWITSWFDVRTLPIRLLLVAVMLGSLFMSAAIPDAFGESGLAFAVPFVAVQVGRNAWTFFAIGRGHPLTENFLRVLLWSIVLGALWLAGGLATGNERFALWALAVATDLVVTWFGFPIPGLGRNRNPGWMIAGGHLAERFELFIILALGESIIVTGATYGELPRSMATIMAFVVAFAGSLTLWWLYFDRGAEVGRAAITRTMDPGWLALSAYSYFHLPMVAGIIVVAAADEVAIAHPTEPVSPATMALLLGGPVLYLIGNALFNGVLFNGVLFGAVPRSRLAAIAVLVALWPLATGATTLALLTAATLVLVFLALWDLRQGMRAVSAGRSGRDLGIA